jgi:hypothetical protein
MITINYQNIDFSFISGERIKAFLAWVKISAIEEWKNQAAAMYVSDWRGRNTRLLQFQHVRD